MSARRALLLLDHGSRQATAHCQLEELAQRVRARRPDLLVAVAHMEIRQPDLNAGLTELAAAGAEEVTVHPYFLAPGLHTKETIPALVASAAEHHPELILHLSEPLGLHEKIVDVVLERYDGPTAR